MPREVTIDFGKIHATAIKGLNRSAVFLGLGVNAADREDLKEYHLTNDTNFRILPESVPDEILAEWKKEFRIWIVGCGFRELVHWLCVFYDRTYLACCIIDRSHDEKKIRNFNRMGMAGKIAKLKNEFGVGSQHDGKLSSFYPIRNCFVHRLGRVGKEDIIDGNPLSLRFLRFQLVFIAPSQKETIIPNSFDPKFQGFVSPVEGGGLGLKWSEKKIEFNRGDWIILSPKDLTQILFFTRWCVKQVTETALDYAKSQGIPINEEVEPSGPECPEAP